MADNVLLFIPNIIDYLRVVLAFASFYYMQTDPRLASALYIISGLLDHIDGPIARYLNQESKFGAILDMLTDRMTTMCLTAALCYFYPKYMLFFQFSMAVDIASHWCYLQSTLMMGRISHKMLGPFANPLLRLYYDNELLMSVLCLANELFYCMLYLCFFEEGPVTVLFGIGLWKLILYVSAPLSFAKMLISLIQLWAAMMNVANIDMADRAAANAKAK